MGDGVGRSAPYGARSLRLDEVARDGLGLWPQTWVVIPSAEMRVMELNPETDSVLLC